MFKDVSIKAFVEWPFRFCCGCFKILIENIEGQHNNAIIAQGVTK